MRKYKITAVIVPGTDPHQSEYISDHWKVRDWVTGFTGSNGTAVITLDDARLWTDSRYFLQAGIELEGTGITMMKEDGGNDPTIEQWLAENLSEGDLLAVDGSLFSVPWRTSVGKSALALLPILLLSTKFTPTARNCHSTRFSCTKKVMPANQHKAKSAGFSMRLLKTEQMQHCYRRSTKWLGSSTFVATT